jgi:hypothetical protein
MSDILILTNSKDGEHTSVVETKLRKRGESVFRLNVDDMVKGLVSIILRCDDSGWGFVISNSNEKIVSSDIKSVWYRRPNFFDFSISDSIQREYAEGELRIFLEGLWLGLSEIFWLNSPWKLESARKKVYQLQVAKELGFAIPRTIITNSPKEVEIFLEKCGGNIVFKAIYGEFLRYNGKQFNIPTTKVTTQHIAKMDLVKSLPSQFQELIDKDYEWRVTIVGDQVFPIKINSQEHKETMIDWRHPDFIMKLCHQISELPKNLTDKCLSMMKILGLSYGAFDFIVDKQGKAYFLEVNSNPQWYWLEHLTGVLISDAIADILTLAPIGRRTRP